MRPWKCLSSTTLVKDRWMNLTADRCQIPSGPILDPYYVIHDSDWVHVLALDADARVLVVRQYRYPGEITCTELPGGVIDAGEAPLEAAKRELLEETGHTASDWVYVGACHANPARQTNRVHLFLARDLQHAGSQNLDDTEEIEFAFLSQAALETEIDAGSFSQSLHIASYYRGMHVMRRAEAAVQGNTPNPS